jgi:hypothetical protein
MDFYDAGALRQIATNLFYGWGYNFYKQENQLRADDQLVRAKAGWLLGVAAAYVQAAGGVYRRRGRSRFPMPRRLPERKSSNGWRTPSARSRTAWPSCRCPRTTA